MHNFIIHRKCLGIFTILLSEPRHFFTDFSTKYWAAVLLHDIDVMFDKSLPCFYILNQI